MTHDPFCIGPCCEWMPQPCGCQCVCDLIDKVRKDQTQRCIAVVESLPVTTHAPVAHPHEGCPDPTIHMIWTPVIALPDILTALEALQEKP